MIYVYGLDAGFVMPTGVSIVSLSRFLGPQDTIAILHVGLGDDDVAALASCAGTTAVIAVDCSALIPPDWPVPPHVTPAAYCRNFAADLLPEATRCVYLDGDTIVRGDPASLAAHDLQGTTAAAVRSRVAPFLASPGGVPTWFALGLRGAAPYFNSGVLVLDLEHWRRRDVNAGVSAFLAAHSAESSLQDQEALNVALYEDWVELDRTWNYVTHVMHSFLPAPENEPVDPSLVHFAGPDKPWRHGRMPPFAEEWYALLAETPWSGYRPQPPTPPRGPRAAVRRVGARGLRSLRSYLREPG